MNILSILGHGISTTDSTTNSVLFEPPPPLYTHTHTQNGYSLLHAAAFSERPDTVQLLLHAGLDPNAIAADVSACVCVLRGGRAGGQELGLTRN